LIYGLAEQARPLIESLLNDSPSDNDLLNMAATSYLILGDYKTSLSIFNKIPRNKFSNPEISLNYTLALLKNGDSKLELVVINPGPIYGPTLTGNLMSESMDFFKKLITGKVPMLPKADSVMSDVRDIAHIHVKALENKKANGNRFIVTTEESHNFQEIAKILKANGYQKISTTLAPTFLLKFMANFDDEAKGMLPFIGNTIEADITLTKNTFNWSYQYRIFK
jgi:nucleoside-diphosphate-sugar epimerase